MPKSHHHHPSSCSNTFADRVHLLFVFALLLAFPSVGLAQTAPIPTTSPPPQPSYPQLLQQQPPQEFDPAPSTAPQPQPNPPQPQPNPPHIGAQGAPQPAAVSYPADPASHSTVYEDAVSRPLIGGQLHLGFGGEVNVLARGRTGRVENSGDVETSFGGAIFSSIPVYDYLALAPALRVFTFTPETSDRTREAGRLMIDFSLAPRGRYVLPGPVPVELFAAMPLGLTFATNSDEMNDFARGNGGEWGTALGFHIGFSAGANIFVAPRFALSADIGYLHHSVSQEFELGRDRADATVSLGQFALNLGAAFRL